MPAFGDDDSPLVGVQEVALVDQQVHYLHDLTRVEAAAADVRRRVQRAQLRPGEAVRLRDLAGQFKVQPTELRSCLDSSTDSDLVTVHKDVITIAPLDLRELRSAMNSLATVVADLITRVPARINAPQLRQLRGLVAAMPRNQEIDPDFYDSGRVFMRRLIGVAGTRHEQQFYDHAIDMVSRYEYLGGAVLAQAEGARALDIAERGQLRLASCHELLGLCAARAPEQVASQLRRYHKWANDTAELSFCSENVSVRRTLRSVG